MQHCVGLAAINHTEVSNAALMEPNKHPAPPNILVDASTTRIYCLRTRIYCLRTRTYCLRTRTYCLHTRTYCLRTRIYCLRTRRLLYVHTRETKRCTRSTPGRQSKLDDSALLQENVVQKSSRYGRGHFKRVSKTCCSFHCTQVDQYSVFA